ncbi:MAG: hypothetical protein ACRD9S_04850 [Pyrinomonadaceae bacterium]
MNFEWDEDKNRENIRKHGIDFNDAWQIFEGPTSGSGSVWLLHFGAGKPFALSPCARHQGMNVRNLKKKSKTDWARIDRMTDDEIDFSDIPPLDDAFFERAIKVLPRVRVDRIDLIEARNYANHILDKKWSHQKKNMAHDAFNTALIMSYCRPFSMRYDLDEKRESPLDRYIGEVLTEEAEFKLHARIKELRDETYAHSDARSHLFPGMDYSKGVHFFKAELNLPKCEVELLKKMIDKWIEYLDEQISITKPPAFLIAPASES